MRSELHFLVLHGTHNMNILTNIFILHFFCFYAGKDKKSICNKLMNGVHYMGVCLRSVWWRILEYTWIKFLFQFLDECTHGTSANECISIHNFFPLCFWLFVYLRLISNESRGTWWRDGEVELVFIKKSKMLKKIFWSFDQVPHPWEKFQLFPTSIQLQLSHFINLISTTIVHI